MKYITLFFIAVGCVVSVTTFLLLAFTSKSIGLSLCIGAIIVFVVGQFIDLIADEIV